MRHILAATVLASPFFLSAAAIAAPPATDATASIPVRSLSTGVTPAHLIYSPNVSLTPAALEALPAGAEVVLSLNVDEKGRVQDIAVVKSPTRYLEAPVAEAVSHYRFSPATLDNQPVATPMTLTVVVQR